jgi:hypothetical protein
MFLTFHLRKKSKENRVFFVEKRSQIANPGTLIISDLFFVVDVVRHAGGPVPKFIDTARAVRALTLDVFGAAALGAGFGALRKVIGVDVPGMDSPGVGTYAPGSEQFACFFFFFFFFFLLVFIHSLSFFFSPKIHMCVHPAATFCTTWSR